MRVPEDIQERVAAYLHHRMTEEEREIFLQDLETSEVLQEELHFQQHLKEDLELLSFKRAFREASSRSQQDLIIPGEDTEPNTGSSTSFLAYDSLFERYFEPERTIPIVPNPALNQLLQIVSQKVHAKDYQQALTALAPAFALTKGGPEEELIHYLQGNFLLSLIPPQVEKALSHLIAIEDIEGASYVETGKAFYTLAMAYLKRGQAVACIARLRKVLGTEGDGYFRNSAEEVLAHLDQE